MPPPLVSHPYLARLDWSLFWALAVLEPEFCLELLRSLSPASHSQGLRTPGGQELDLTHFCVARILHSSGLNWENSSSPSALSPVPSFPRESLSTVELHIITKKGRPVRPSAWVAQIVLTVCPGHYRTQGVQVENLDFILKANREPWKVCEQGVVRTTSIDSICFSLSDLLYSV